VDFLASTRGRVACKDNTDHTLFDFNRCTDLELWFFRVPFNRSAFRFVLVLVVAHRFPLAI
jgi:hypothetical protein